MLPRGSASFSAVGGRLLESDNLAKVVALA
jgi:hypothetical protein